MAAREKKQEKIAIVTGANRGIGRAIAGKLCAQGATVYLVSRKGCAEAAEELQKKGFKAFSYSCDVSAEEQVKKLFGLVTQKHGRLDILVNNASVVQNGKIEGISLEDWNFVMGNNITSTFLTCRQAVPIMKAQKSGKIINIASIAGRFRSVLSAINYVTSKAAVIGFTRQLAYELGSFGINVNVVCPSQTDTPMLRSVLTPEGEENLKKVIPLGRIAKPEEIANVVAFLSSDESSYMTGAVVDVNGGQFSS